MNHLCQTCRRWAPSTLFITCFIKPVSTHVTEKCLYIKQCSQIHQTLGPDLGSMSGWGTRSSWCWTNWPISPIGWRKSSTQVLSMDSLPSQLSQQCKGHLKNQESYSNITQWNPFTVSYHCFPKVWRWTDEIVSRSPSQALTLADLSWHDIKTVAVQTCTDYEPAHDPIICFFAPRAVEAMGLESRMRPSLKTQTQFLSLDLPGTHVSSPNWRDRPVLPKAEAKSKAKPRRRAKKGEAHAKAKAKAKAKN